MFNLDIKLLQLTFYYYKINKVLYTKKLLKKVYTNGKRYYVQNILNQIHVKENYIHDNMKKNPH